MCGIITFHLGRGGGAGLRRIRRGSFMVVVPLLIFHINAVTIYL